VSDGEARQLSPIGQRPLLLRHLGCRSYPETWQEMVAFTAARDAATGDELWSCEHPPVFTLGQAGRPEHLLFDSGIPLLRTDRGGQITYHGPGQVVIYLLIDLARRRLKVRELVVMIEQAVIELLAENGVAAARHAGAPGVYVGAAKVAALGLRVQERLLLPWCQPECGYGSFAVFGDQSLWLCRHGGHTDEGSRHCADAATSGRSADEASHCTTGAKGKISMSERGVKQKGELKTARIPIKIVPQVPQKKPEWIRVKAGKRQRSLWRDQADAARAEAAYRLRGSSLSEHRRVFRSWYRDLHDPRRHLHAPLPVL
jgi:hypothetical protein